LSVPDSAPTFAASWALAGAARTRVDATAKTILGQPRMLRVLAVSLLACPARMTRLRPPWGRARPRVLRDPPVRPPTSRSPRQPAGCPFQLLPGGPCRGID